MGILPVAHTATQVEMRLSRWMHEEIAVDRSGAGTIARRSKLLGAAMHVAHLLATSPDAASLEGEWVSKRRPAPPQGDRTPRPTLRATYVVSGFSASVDGKWIIVALSCARATS